MPPTAVIDVRGRLFCVCVCHTAISVIDRVCHELIEGLSCTSTEDTDTIVRAYTVRSYACLSVTIVCSVARKALEQALDLFENLDSRRKNRNKYMYGSTSGKF